jgi:hypothetical protein
MGMRGEYGISDPHRDFPSYHDIMKFNLHSAAPGRPSLEY